MLVYFTNLSRVKNGTVPNEEAVSRDIPSSSNPIQAALDEYFRGPSAAERSRGLFAPWDGFVGYQRLQFSNGILRVYLSGSCQPENSAYNISQPLIATLKQFEGVEYVKLYDEYGHSRDREGRTQTVFDPSVLPPEVFEMASSLHSESVITVTGKVRPRPPGTTNPKIVTGEVEVMAQSFDVLNMAEVLPFPVDDPELAVPQAATLYHALSADAGVLYGLGIAGKSRSAAGVVYEAEVAVVHLGAGGRPARVGGVRFHLASHPSGVAVTPRGVLLVLATRELLAFSLADPVAPRQVARLELSSDPDDRWIELAVLDSGAAVAVLDASRNRVRAISLADPAAPSTCFSTVLGRSCARASGAARGVAPEAVGR